MTNDERRTERYVDKLINYFASENAGDGLRTINKHDLAYYTKRARQYKELENEQIDPRDYSARNLNSHKRRVIRENFRDIVYTLGKPIIQRND